MNYASLKKITFFALIDYYTNRYIFTLNKN